MKHPYQIICIIGLLKMNPLTR